MKNKIHLFVLGAGKNLGRVPCLFVSVWMTKISAFVNNNNGFFSKENTDSLHPQITLNPLTCFHAWAPINSHYLPEYLFIWCYGKGFQNVHSIRRGFWVQAVSTLHAMFIGSETGQLKDKYQAGYSTLIKLPGVPFFKIKNNTTIL